MPSLLAVAGGGPGPASSASGVAAGVGGGLPPGAGRRFRCPRRAAALARGRRATFARPSSSAVVAIDRSRWRPWFVVSMRLQVRQALSRRSGPDGTSSGDGIAAALTDPARPCAGAPGLGRRAGRRGGRARAGRGRRADTRAGGPSGRRIRSAARRTLAARRICFTLRRYIGQRALVAPRRSRRRADAVGRDRRRAAAARPAGLRPPDPASAAASAAARSR